jgi:hypothetical protein
MNEFDLIQQFSIRALEQRVEFGCCGGGDGGNSGGTPGGPGPGGCGGECLEE